MAQSSDNSLKSMGPIMFGGKDKVLEWFQGKGIVPATKLCERCPNSQQMVLTVKSDVADGYKFRCPACKTFKSVRGGRSQTGQQSFFHNSKICLQVWMMIMWMWSRQWPVTKAAEECGINEGNAIDFYQFFRDICSWKLVNTIIKLGGPGVVVQIDESLMTHSPKVSKRVNNNCYTCNSFHVPHC